MNPLEHAVTLQNMLTAIPAIGIMASLVAFLLALSLVPFSPLHWSSMRIFFEPLRPPWIGWNPNIERHTLQEAFANGILNPRLF